MNTSLGYGHSTLFHDLMYCCAVNVTHLQGGGRGGEEEGERDRRQARREREGGRGDWDDFR